MKCASHSVLLYSTEAQVETIQQHFIYIVQYYKKAIKKNNQKEEQRAVHFRSLKKKLEQVELVIKTVRHLNSNNCTSSFVRQMEKLVNLGSCIIKISLMPLFTYLCKSIVLPFMCLTTPDLKQGTQFYAWQRNKEILLQSQDQKFVSDNKRNCRMCGKQKKNPGTFINQLQKSAGAGSFSFQLGDRRSLVSCICYENLCLSQTAADE